VREAVILGVIQGLTEFLPISSIAHLRIIPAFLGWEDPGAAYSAVLQLGTLLAVLLYFASDLYGLIRSAWHDVRRRRPLSRWRSDRATIARTMRRTSPPLPAR
jgi:undecaprenyl-diphosphatase